MITIILLSLVICVLVGFLINLMLWLMDLQIHLNKFRIYLRAIKISNVRIKKLVKQDTYKNELITYYYDHV